MSVYSDLADAIVDHADAIARLDAKRLGADAFDAEVDEHVHAIRMLAVPHIDPVADRAFFKAIKAATQGRSGVYVHMPDGVIEFLVDSPRGQRTFALWNARELREGGPR